MSIKYLSPSGLTEVWSNIKTYIASKIPSKIVTGLSIKGRTITYTNSDGTTGTLTTQDTDTTYASMSAAEATTGTATTARSISAKVLHDKITSITNAKADDANVVHKSGAETIFGPKTFSSDTSTVIALKNERMVNGQDDTVNRFWSISLTDKNDKQSARILRFVNADNASAYMLYDYYKGDSSNQARIGVGHTQNGQAYVFWDAGIKNDTYPSTNDTYTLGTSTLKWKAVYANAFNGNLVGNANTATKATQDAAGNIITTTYAKDANVVHKSGNETIVGTKTFSSQIKGNISGTSSDVVVGSDTATTRGYLVDSKLPRYTWEEGSQLIAGRVPLITDFNNLTKPGVYHVVFCLNDGFIHEEKEYKESLNRPSIPDSTTGFRDGILEIKQTSTMSNISSRDRFTQKLTVLSGISTRSYFDLTYQRACVMYSPSTWSAWKRVARDEEVVHNTGNETIAGSKTFSDARTKFYKSLDLYHDEDYKLNTNPSVKAYQYVFFTGKSGWYSAYLENQVGTDGASYCNLAVRNTNERPATVQLAIDSNGVKTFKPISDNDISLGASTRKWKAVYANAFNGNLVGNANTATYATTQATTDNSTKIATTAWVRTYVNSAVGSGSVGTTITAYWGSSSSTGNKWAMVSSLNGTERVSSTTNTFTPVVGQIYSGNQLYSTAMPGAGIGDTGLLGVSPSVVYARLDLSGAFNSSYKYLCTTAVGVNATASVDVTGHTAYGSSGPHTTITGYGGLTKTVQGGKSTFLRVQ